MHSTKLIKTVGLYFIKDQHKIKQQLSN